jgi:RNA polymerase sigma factor (sigma-70 family)
LKNLSAIIRGCIAKDSRCQKLIYERYYGYALKIVFRYSYDYRLATDLVNDGFVKFFSNIGSFINQGGHSEPSLMIWIKRLMVKIAVAELKRKNFLYKAGVIPEQFWQTASSQQDEDMLLEYKKLICHLKSLPAFYGVVYNMHVIDGFSHQEIAAQLNISILKSRSNLCDAKAFLRELINRDEESVVAWRVAT